MKKYKVLIYLTLVSVLLIGFKIQNDKKHDLVRFVDPFIGSGGHGHVFVGANVPFGGVQVGPTNFNKGWDWSSSYHYSDSIVKGFCHLNVSGTSKNTKRRSKLQISYRDRKTYCRTWIWCHNWWWSWNYGSRK